MKAGGGDAAIGRKGFVAGYFDFPYGKVSRTRSGKAGRSDPEERRETSFPRINGERKGEGDGLDCHAVRCRGKRKKRSDGKQSFHAERKTVVRDY